jgi:ABC-type Fe3+/spermidine/putrescine transport system ATPase subunit
MEAVEIRLNNITKNFQHRVKGKVTAVNDVSLTVEPGELLTILGPSGCGKTTTLRIIAGFEQPDRGRVSIAGEDVTDRMANRRDIGFVFQNYALFPHLSIFENVAYGLKVQGQSRTEIDKAVADVLQLVGLGGYEHQFPHQVSGGEQQRVALARAIVIEPKVLLFDEPLSNLDAKLRVHTRSEIRSLQRRLAITSIYVTHDQEEAMAISDRIVVMNRGSIAQIGTAEELYFSPRSEFVARFIGKVNALPALVEEADEKTVTLSVFGHTYRAPAPDAAVYTVKTGQRLEAFIRPEFVELVHEPGKGHFSAVISECTFLGEKVEYGLECDGTSLSAVAHPLAGGQVLEPGRKVGVRLQGESIRLLKQGGTT